LNREEQWVKAIIKDDLEAFKEASELFDKFTA